MLFFYINFVVFSHCFSNRAITFGYQRVYIVLVTLQCYYGRKITAIIMKMPMWPVWHSGNTLDSINLVTLHYSIHQLVPGWVTVLRWVNHLGTEPGTQVDSAWAIPLWVGKNKYWLQLRLLGKNSKSCITAGIPFYSRLKALAVDVGQHRSYASLIGINPRRLKVMQSGRAPSQRTLAVYALCKILFFLFFFYHHGRNYQNIHYSQWP